MLFKGSAGCSNTKRQSCGDRKTLMNTERQNEKMRVCARACVWGEGVGGHDVRVL